MYRDRAMSSREFREGVDHFSGLEKLNISFTASSPYG